MTMYSTVSIESTESTDHHEIRAAIRHTFDMISLWKILNFMFLGPWGLDQRRLGIQRLSGEER